MDIQTEHGISSHELMTIRFAEIRSTDWSLALESWLVAGLASDFININVIRFVFDVICVFGFLSQNSSHFLSFFSFCLKPSLKPTNFLELIATPMLIGILVTV